MVHRTEDMEDGKRSRSMIISESIRETREQVKEWKRQGLRPHYGISA